MIGAECLSKMAARLETAGNELDIGTIMSDTNKLLEEYRDLGRLITAVIGREETKGGEEDDKPLISEKTLSDAFDTMKDFARVYDYDNMIFVLDSLKEYKLRPEDGELISRLNRLTEEFKWEEINDILKDR